MGKASTLDELQERYMQQWDAGYSRFCPSRRKLFRNPEKATQEQLLAQFKAFRRDLRAPRLMDKLEKRIWPRGKAICRVR